jgi:23S rRNA (pseudouridine1915-N3)-methyltransferase
VKITIISVGKERDMPFQDALCHYELKVLRYVPFEWHFISHQHTKEQEGENILHAIKRDDYVVLLDEKGSDMTSEGFAELIENRMLDSVKRMVCVIGGAYGIDSRVRLRANYTWRLSWLVFPHMLVRVVLIEQIYRAMTILQGEKYHHG